MYLCSGVLQKALIMLLNFSDELPPRKKKERANHVQWSYAHKRRLRFST